MSRIHIVFGDSAMGGLRQALNILNPENRGRILSAGDLFSAGPLGGPDEEEGLRRRREWWLRLCRDIGADRGTEDYFLSQPGLLAASLAEVRREDEVCIWYGSNASDQTGLRYIINRLEGESPDVFLLNVSDFQVPDSSGRLYRPRSAGECSPERLAELAGSFSVLSDHEARELREEWKSLSRREDVLRNWKDGELREADETYFDEMLSGAAGEDFLMAARIVGTVMGRSDQLVSDLYLEWRLRKLIDTGRLEARGDMSALRFYEVRRKGC